mgnify:CR=1 FL=1
MRRRANQANVAAPPGASDGTDAGTAEPDTVTSPAPGPTATAGANPSDGSSSSKARGFAIMARPMASICCSPPPKWPGYTARGSKGR